MPAISALRLHRRAHGSTAPRATARSATRCRPRPALDWRTGSPDRLPGRGWRHSVFAERTRGAARRRRVAGDIVWNNRGYGEIKTSMLAVDIDPEGVDVPAAGLHSARARLRLCAPRSTAWSRCNDALRDFAARRQVVMLEVEAARFE